MTGNLLRPVKHTIDVLGTRRMTREMRLVTNAQFRANFRRALLIAKQDHFHVGMKKLPALQGIPLDDAGMTEKRLCRGK
jgi:hypothetical protein